MTITRRILLLAAISIGGIALIAPLAARSAVPVAPELEEHLLTISEAPPAGMSAVDRGTLSVRGLSVSAPSSDKPESLGGEPIPTPATAPMEATLYEVAPPPPPPPPQREVTYAGTSVWDDLARCESGGNWAINTGNGYYGGLQFSYGTWHQYGGGEFAEYPHEASRAEQIIVAERLRADRGYAPWPACRAKLGLP
jgi:hypothetical protein